MIPPLEIEEHSHRRYNPLNGEWVLVSPSRIERPWQGQVEVPEQKGLPGYDSECYLCPGNRRASGDVNPSYTSTFVFDNDFGALQLHTPISKFQNRELLLAQGEPGICRVVCFSPRHNQSLPEMPIKDIRQVVDRWTQEYLHLGSMDAIGYVQIFENKGRMMGCSNPHPHGQVWAERSRPVEVEKEVRNFRAYTQRTNGCMLCDYLALELENQERIVFVNDHYVVIVPFWAIWPFETLIISKGHLKDLSAFSDKEKDSFADILKRLTTCYDNLFRTSFPYSAGIHQSPCDGASYSEFHFHMHFYPPLLRSATVKKFLVGYEMLANPQRDLLPEQSASAMRDLSDIHHRLVQES